MVQAEVGRVELDARLRNAPPEQSPHVDGDITPGLLAVTRGRECAVPPRAHGRGPAPRRVDGRSARVHRRVDVDRSRRVRRGRGSPTRGTTRSSASPTAPTSRSWVTRPADSPRSPPRSPTRGRPHEVARRGAADPRRALRAGARLPHARSALRPLRLPRGRGAHRPTARRDAVGATSGACSSEVEPGARVAGAPFRSDRTTDRRARPGAAVRPAHPCRAGRAPAGCPTTSSLSSNTTRSSTRRATSTPPVPTGSSGPRPVVMR